MHAKQVIYHEATSPAKKKIYIYIEIYIYIYNFSDSEGIKKFLE
jgi:hypothetical protein